MATSRQRVITYTIVFVNSIAIPVTIWWVQVRADVRATRLGVAQQRSATVSSLSFQVLTVAVSLFSSVHSFIHPFIHSSIRPFVCSFVRSFVRSFIIIHSCNKNLHLSPWLQTINNNSLRATANLFLDMFYCSCFLLTSANTSSWHQSLFWNWISVWWYL